MLNLSDKELDRLARQAANEYDPGGFAGPEQWNRLHAGLDKELGKVRFNPFRAIRRIPFYYAPAMLLLAGVAYYFISHSRSGSPPRAVVRTLPPQRGHDATPARSNESDYANSDTKNLPPHKSTSTPEKQPETNPASDKGPLAAENHAGMGSHALPSSTTLKGVNAATVNAATVNAARSNVNAGNVTKGNARAGNTRDHEYARNAGTGNTGLARNARTGVNRNKNVRGNATGNGSNGATGSTVTAGNNGRGDENASHAVRTPGEATTRGEPQYTSPDEQLTHASTPVVTIGRMHGPGPITLGKPHGPSMRIDRSLQFGIVIAPDFASVNSLAGDRPGRSFGVTVDYQFVNKLYLSTGILFSRKNYTAAAQDYHVSYNYYRANNMHNVDYVKGTFNLLEIPLNLRYDFSVSGNTSFFAVGGVSSYLLTKENCNYYFDLFGREASKGFDYTANGNHLFTAVNLSFGVETGLSNDLSLLIAPYVKVPTRGIGFGGVEMNSMGINFGLKYTPVLSRRRH